MSFRIWLEDASDLYGFLAPSTPSPAPTDETPIKPFSLHVVTTWLLRHPLGSVLPIEHFTDEVRWGRSIGSIRIKFSPNLDARISRLIDDLQGNPTWICLKVYNIDEKGYAGQEELVAQELMDKVQKMSHQDIPRVLRDYQDLTSLTQALARDIRAVLPDLFTFEDIKTVSPSNYIIYCSLRGVGVGRLMTSAQTPFLNVNISYQKDTGLLRIIVNMINIEPDGGFWEVSLPFFDEYFVPSQPSQEISRTIVTALRYF